MTLMLGIYSKKKLDKSKLKSIIKEFSLDGKRHLYTEHHGSIILSVLKSPNSGIAKNSGETLTAAFSGRLYNLSKDLKVLSGKGHKFKSNSNLAEFILHAYEEYGVSFFNSLRGQFSFCIYDKNLTEVIVVNDQFGIYPLFSYEDENIVITRINATTIIDDQPNLKHTTGTIGHRRWICSGERTGIST